MQKAFLVLQACNFFLYPAAWNQIWSLTEGEQFDLIFCSPSVSYLICIHAAGCVQLNVCNGQTV